MTGRQHKSQNKASFLSRHTTNPSLVDTANNIPCQPSPWQFSFNFETEITLTSTLIEYTCLLVPLNSWKSLEHHFLMIVLRFRLLTLVVIQTQFVKPRKMASFEFKFSLILRFPSASYMPEIYWLGLSITVSGHNVPSIPPKCPIPKCPQTEMSPISFYQNNSIFHCQTG